MASREKRRPYVRWRPCVSVLFLLSLVQLGRAIHLPGTDSSYARFPKWNACINASIMFEFKSTKDNTLLMYTDDGGTYDYFELRLQNGRVHLRLNIVNGTDTSTEIIRGHNLIDGEWHRVEIRRKRMETTLIVDGESESKTSYGTDFYFGSLKTNSPVYVGGVPLDYITNLHKLALASVAFENHFKGSIQNVMYSNCSCQTVRADYVAGIEVQQFPPEACERRNPCKDGCVCISKNDEPYCDCSGIQCVKGSVTHYHLPMDYVIGTYLVNPSGLDSTAFGRPKATRGIISRAQNMNTRNQYIKVSGPGHRYECLGDLDLCQLGYTLGFWVKFEGNSHKDHEGIYLSNGGHSPRSHGVAMYYKDGNLRFKFKRKNGQEWTASSDNVLLGRWYHVAVTWGLQKGLFLYINGRQVGRDINPTTKTQGTLDKNLNEFYIGRPNDGSGTQNYGNMVVDEFHFWSIFKTAEDIREIGPFYNYILPMDARKGEQFQYSNVPVTIQGSPNIVPGQIGNAVDLNGRREYISLGELPGSCLSDLEKCIYGLTMAMWIKFTDLKENTYYIDTGNKGFKLYYKNGKLHADFQRGLNWWTTSWDGVQKDRWYFLELSWDPQEGIEMFVDQNSVAYSEDLEKREPKTSTIDNSVYIGRANTNMRSERFAAATIDDLELWYGDRGRLIDFDFIQRGRPKMHTFPMDIIQGNLLVTPTLFATVDGYPRLVGGKMKKALELNGVNQYVTVKDQNDNCLGNVNLCPHGFLISFWIKPGEFKNKMQYIATGVNGVTLIYDQGKLNARVATSAQQWEASTDKLKTDTWYFAELSWSPRTGIKLLLDDKMVAHDAKSEARAFPSGYSYNPDNDKFYIGRSNEDMTGKAYGNLTLDEMDIWFGNRDYLLAHNYIQRGRPTRIYLDMDAIQGRRLVHPNMKIDLFGNPVLVPGKANSALKLNGNSQYLDAGKSGDRCLGDLSRCPHGYTFSTWAKFDNLQDDTYYMSTGNKGVNMFYKNGMLHVTFNQPGKEWKTSVRGVQPDKWYFIEATWHPDHGAQMYFDNKLVSYITGPMRVPPKRATQNNHFYVGRANSGDTQNGYYKYPSATFDDFEIWYLNREDLLAFNYIQRDYVPHYTIPFETLQGDKILHPLFNMHLHNGAFLADGRFGKALNLNGQRQYVDLGDQSNNCIGNLDRCNHGLTTSFHIYPRELHDDTYILAGGPYSVYQKNGKTVVEYKTKTKTWTISTDKLKPKQWQQVEISWHPERGLGMYLNKTRVAFTKEFTTREASPVSNDYRIYVGKTSDMRNRNYLNGMVDEIEYWTAPREFIVANNMWPKDVKVGEILDMDNIVGNLMAHAQRPVRVYGNPTVVQGEINKAVDFDGRGQYLDLGQNVTCKGNLLKCTRGFTLRFRIKPKEFREKMYYFSGVPLDVYFRNGKLRADFYTPTHKWSVGSSDLSLHQWYLVDLSWDPANGLSMYIDGKSADSNMMPSLNEDVYNPDRRFYIGRANTPMTDEKYANAVMDDVELWDAKRDILIGESLIAADGSDPKVTPVQPADKVLIFDGRSWVTYDASKLPPEFLRQNNREQFHMQFKTRKPNGVLWYTGNDDRNMFLSLKNGQLVLGVEYGDGKTPDVFPIRYPKGRLDDGRLHNVIITRDGQRISVDVDGVKDDNFLRGDINIVGSGNIYIGGSSNPSRDSNYQVNTNFEGTVQKVLLKGDSFPRDFNLLDETYRSPRPGYIYLIGDVGMTDLGDNNDAPIIGFDGTSRVRVNFTPHISTHRDDVSLRFRTPRENGLLFSTSRLGSNKYLRVMLENGRAKMVTNLGGETTTKYSGENLDDDDWHTVYLRRRGNEMEIWVDDEEKAKFKLPGSGFDMDLDEIVVGAINEKQNPDERFVGHMTNFIYNKRKFFELLDLNNLPKGVFRGEKSLSVNEATFRSNVDSHTTLPGLQFPTNSKMSFMFKTKEPNGLIFFNKGTGDEYIAIELVDGLLHFLVDAGNGPKTKVADTPSKLNNNEWHKVSFTRTSMSDFRIKVDDSVSNLDIGSGGSRLAILGNLYVGGVPSQKMKELPALVASKRGYAGCLASLKVNRKLYNLLTDSSTTSRNILSGCRSVDSLDHCIGVTCGLGGACISTPDTFMCDCNMTAQVGTVCRNEAEGYRYGLNEGKGYFEYGLREQRNTNLDKLAFGFKTWYKNGSLVRIDGAGNEYIIVKLVNGHVVLMYDIGDGEHVLTESSQTYNDGEFHAVRFTRYGANGTLIVDSYPAIVQKHKSSVGIFNNQDMVKLGGNRINGKIQDAFNGILAGVYFNGMRFIDLAQGKVINPYIEGDVRVARHPFFLPRPSIKPGPVVTVKPPVVVPSKKPPPPPVEPVVPPGKGKVGVAWTPVGKGDGVVVVASNGVGGAGSTASGGAGAAGGAGTGGGAVAGGTGGGVVAAAVAAPAGPGVVEPGARGGVVAGSFLAVLALVSSAIWAFYKCKPGVCPFGGGGGGGGGGGAGGMSISAPRAATNFSLVRAQGMGAGGGGSYGRGAGGGASASSTLVTANASNGKAGAGGAGAGGMSQFNEYFSSMTTSSMTANSVGGGSAAGGGGVATAVVSVHDAGVQVGGGSGVGNAAASGMSVTRTAVYETVTISGGAAGGGGKSAHVATQADTLGLGRLAWGKYGMGFDTLSSKNSVTLVSDGQSYSGAGYHTGGGGGSVSSAQFSSMQRDADMTSQTTTHVRDQSISSADQLSMGGGGYAYSTASSAGVQTGGQTTGYDSMSSNQVSTGVQAEMNGRAGGTGYGDSLNVMQSSSFSSYKSESYSTAMQGGGGGADSQAFAYRAGSPYGFDGSVASSAGGAGGTYRMQSMVLNTGGLLGVAAGSRATSPVPYMTDEIKVDCVLMTADGNYAITGSGCGPPQIWDLRSGELIRVMRSHDLGSTDLHLASGDSLLVGQVSTEATQADVTETQTGAKISNRKLQIWDFATGKPLEMSDAVVFSASCLMRDGEKMVLGRTEKFGNGTSIVVWDLLGNQAVREMHYDAAIGFADSINYLNISRDSRYVIAGFQNSYDGNANFIVFDMSVHTNNIVDPKILALDAVSECTAVLDNHEAVTGTRKGELLIWSMKTGKALRQLISASGYNTLNRMGMPSAAAHASEVKAVDVSHDGKFLISASADSTLKVWNLETEKLVHTLRGHTDEVWCCTISHDNDLIVSGSRDGTIRVWRMNSGAQICLFTAGVDVFSAKISSDKHTVVALGDKFASRKLIMLQVIHTRSIASGQ